MFNYFKYRRLNNFLSDADFNSRSNSKPKLERIAWAMDTVLNIYTEEGKQNYEKLMETLYENQPAASRIKLLVLISQLILQDRPYAEGFLKHKKLEFQGMVIRRKQQTNQTARMDSHRDMTMYGPETNVSVTRACMTRRQIDDEVTYSDVNVYLHLYIVVPFIAYLLKLSASYDLYDDCRRPVENLRSADFTVIWKLINTIKSVLPIKSVLTHVGRYYPNEIPYMISFIETLTNSLSAFYSQLEQHVSTALDSYKKMSEQEMQNLLGIVEEIIILNEGLYEIYFNRYFSKQTKHIAVPKWISLENDEAETIYRHFQSEFGVHSKTLRSMTAEGKQMVEKTERIDRRSSRFQEI